MIKRYENIEKKEKSPELIDGQMYKIGSIRNNYVFSFNITNKNCTFNNYYREEFQKNLLPYNPDKPHYNHYTYEYVKTKNFVEYSFCLNNLSTQDTMINQIKEILPNNCNIYIKDNCLSITLETKINHIIDCNISELIIYVDYIDAIYQKLSTILPNKK